MRGKPLRGYETMGYVDSNMTAMRDGKYPIDSFIMDYDWFGPAPCGGPFLFFCDQ